MIVLLYVIFKGESFAGYFIGPLRELTLTDEADFTDVLRRYTSEYGSLDLALPQYETGKIEAAHKFCASCSMGTDKYFSRFHSRDPRQYRYCAVCLSFNGRGLCDFRLGCYVYVSVSACRCVDRRVVWVETAFA